MSKKNKWTSNLSRPNASGLHRETLAILKKLFKNFVIRQEYPIEVLDQRGKSRILYLDFFIEELSLAIECQGIQHFKKNEFFHSKDGSFKQQQTNDRLKKRWCELSEVSLIEITYKEKPSEELITRKINEVL